MGKLYRGEALAKTPFCNNPKCDTHRYQVTPDVARIELLKPGVIIGSMSKKFVTRNLFQSEGGTRKAFFCEVCESAIDTAYRVVGEPERTRQEEQVEIVSDILSQTRGVFEDMPFSAGNMPSGKKNKG